MGWLARVIVPSAAFVLVGCAAIANFGDTETSTGEQNPGSSGTPSTSGMTSGTTSGGVADSGSSSGDSGGPTGEAGIDGAPTCPAPKLANGNACTAVAECCSNACTEDHTCNGKCSTGGGGFSCAPFRSDQCCVGFYCSTNAFGSCVSCRATGTDAEVYQTLGGGMAVDPLSCCSGHADSGTKKCTP